MRRCFLVFLGLLVLALTAWSPLPPVAVYPGYAIVFNQDRQLIITLQSDRLLSTNSGEEQPVEPGRTNTTAVQLLVDKASADLGQRLNVAADEIALWSIQPATFRDASLGRPQPGRMYAQVLTAGYKITLRSGDAFYLYHAAGVTVVFAGQAGKLPDNLPDATR